MPDKVSSWSKLNEVADDNLIVPCKMISVFNRIRTLSEKQKTLVTSIFFIFPQCFRKTYTAHT